MAKGKKHAKKDHGKGRRRGGHKSFKMPDTGDLESQLRDLGLCTKDMAGDGNCLFRALSDQYHGYDTEYPTIRHDVCEFLREYEDEYKFFVEDDNSFDHHLECMAEDGTYGGNMELAAFARMRQVDIKVYQPGLIYVIRGVDENEEAETILHIAYHSWEHYSSVRNLDGPFTGPPEVKIAQEPQADKEEKEGDEDEAAGTNPLDSKEKVVLAACPDTNIRKIRRLLRKHKGDPDKVIEVLYDISTEEPEEPPKQKQVIAQPENQQPYINEDPSIKDDHPSTKQQQQQQPLEKQNEDGADEAERKDNGSESIDKQSPADKAESKSCNIDGTEALEAAVKEKNDEKKENGQEDKEEKEMKTPEKPKGLSKKKAKKLTAHQKKQMQKERQRAKWLEKHKNQDVNRNDGEPSTLTNAMKEMYI